MSRDYTQLITSQHRSRPKYSAMVAAVASSFGAIYDQSQAMRALFDVDTAVAAQLDVIGQWVGQSRIIQVTDLVFFGFSDNPLALPLGDESNLSIGGAFYEDGDDYTGTTILNDPEYRLLIRGKIARNRSKGTTSDIVDAITFLIEAPASIDDPGTMVIGVIIRRNLSTREMSLLKQRDVLPRPSGVRIGWLAYVPAAGYLGWDTQIGALPFYEEGSSSLIGFLMEEF